MKKINLKPEGNPLTVEELLTAVVKEREKDLQRVEDELNNYYKNLKNGTRTKT